MIKSSNMVLPASFLEKNHPIRHKSVIFWSDRDWVGYHLTGSNLMILASGYIKLQIVGSYFNFDFCSSKSIDDVDDRCCDGSSNDRGLVWCASNGALDDHGPGCVGTNPNPPVHGKGAKDGICPFPRSLWWKKPQLFCFVVNGKPEPNKLEGKKFPAMP